MTLAELRKLAIRQQLRIHFRLQNGMECVINEHGTAKVPELRVVPDFNLERELGQAGEFTLEPAAPADAKAAPKVRLLVRDEMAAMVTSTAPAGGPHPEREDE